MHRPAYDPAQRHPGSNASGGPGRITFTPVPYVPIFVKSIFKTDCDECGDRFTPGRGGVCVGCRRILCFKDLHGSIARHALVYFGAKSLCVACRTEGTDAVLARLAAEGAPAAR